VITLVQHGWQATGIDFVPKAIRQARRSAAGLNLDVDFRVGDVTRLEDLQGPFDLVLDIGCFHSIDRERRRAYINNLIRLLAPQGTFMMYGHFLNPDETPGQVLAGLHEDDLALLNTSLVLKRRQDGMERNERPAAWFWYQK
jgi:cyclopropane fatty-acyl-phospholipid synthase-like methyltransferase